MYRKIEDFLYHIKGICDDNDVRGTIYLNCLINPISECK